jgi:hypothetical protein
LDLNLWNGDVAAMKTDLGIVDTNPPPVEPPTTGDANLSALIARVERLEAFMATVKGA